MSGWTSRRRLVVAASCLAAVVVAVPVGGLTLQRLGGDADRTPVGRVGASRGTPAGEASDADPGTTPGSSSGSTAGAGGTPPAADPGRQVPTDPSAEIGGLLAERARALVRGDREGWLDPLDVAGTPAARRFRQAQADVFDRVTTLRPVTWSYRVGGGSPLAPARREALGGVAWLADVQLLYRLDPGSPLVHRQQFVTVVRRAGRWRLAGDTDGETGRDIWDVGPVTRAVAPRCLVVGAAERRRQVRQMAAECGAAAGPVDVAWGTGWPRRTVLTVPGTVGQLAVLLGRGNGAQVPAGGGVDAGLERTAAVTVGPADGPADEVLVNGEAFAQLTDLGRRVVLTHELVHVATRATGARAAPTWLSEGYADHVAYAGSGLAAEKVAGEALHAVREGRLPTDLPATEDFDAAGDRAAAAYGGAWVAVDVVAGTVDGPAGLRRFYERAAAPGSAALGLEAALASTGLQDRDRLVRAWQTRLIELAT